MTGRRLVLLAIFLLPLLCTALPAMAQRNASFLSPASTGGKPGEGAAAALANTLVADPASIDSGETLVNVARRITVFFFNNFRAPVTVAGLQLNADGNVRSKIISDDCADLKTIPVQDRCAVALEITPSSPGPWSVELLMTHSGQGRIARAEVIGSTLGKADERAEGLAISKKIAAPLDFGPVKAYEEKAVRTLLIENDSMEPLTISTIDLIALGNEGLSLRNKGCKEGDELKPGESCPVTVIWEPHGGGNISTDLIMRHTGNLGFVVVPIRGNATVESEEGGKDGDGKKTAGGKSPGGTSLVPRSNYAGTQSSSPSLNTLPTLSMPSPGQVATQIPPMQSGSLSAPGLDSEGGRALPMLALIGTVGGRAILGGADGQTTVIGLGEKKPVDGVEVELLQLEPTRAVIRYEGARLELSLRRAPSFLKMPDEREKKEGTSGSGGGSPLLIAPQGNSESLAPALKPATPPPVTPMAAPAPVPPPAMPANI